MLKLVDLFLRVFYKDEYIHVGNIHKVWVDEDETNGLLFEEKDKIRKNKKEKVVAKFLELEKEVNDLIKQKQIEFELFLDKNGLESGMGSIGKKEKK
jgi:hypothetical protein